MRIYGTSFKRTCWPGGTSVPRHRHDGGYAAIVLNGSYEEVGEQGRLQVRAGDVLMHQPFASHLNRIGRRGAEIMHIELPSWSAAWRPHGRIEDLDRIVRVAERDPTEAFDLLQSQLSPGGGACLDWPDLLAAAMLEDPKLQVGAWARSHGLVAETASRRFQKVYGVTPSRFRAEARVSQAWRLITGGGLPLAQIAVSCGYTDQAHMTRWMAAVTGCTPGAWRRRGSNSCNTLGA